MSSWGRSTAPGNSRKGIRDPQSACLGNQESPTRACTRGHQDLQPHQIGEWGASLPQRNEPKPWQDPASTWYQVSREQTPSRGSVCGAGRDTGWGGGSGLRLRVQWEWSAQ